MLWLFKINFRGFRSFLIHGNSSYVVLYTQCLRYNIFSAWFLDIRISTCLDYRAVSPFYVWQKRMAWRFLSALKNGPNAFYN